jgi:ABC-type transporter Mla MlaB component
MAKEDSASAGLFSKVAKFVRNPVTSWSELDQKESDRESSYSKQALKEMIERKRRNDFVRKREFDMLRKLRRREAMGGAPAGSADGSARPSFFQSSMPSKPDDRAMTLKKIDEIEAQMSMQWWKTKHGGGASSTINGGNSSFPGSDISLNSSNNSNDQSVAPVAPSPAAQAMAYARTEPDDLTNALARAATKLSATTAASTAAAQQQAAAGLAARAAAVAPVAPVVATPVQRPQQQAPAAAPSAPAAAAQPTAAQVAQTAHNRMNGLSASYEGGATTGFSASKLFAVEVDEVQHDPELEEAAIRFANGDDAGAEAGLLEVLAPHGARHEHEETWFTAFDLYRATGQHDRFESLAIDFAGKFGRSAPLWFSMPDMVGLMNQAEAIAGPATVLKSDWRCPANFGLQTIAALNAALAKAVMPWKLDWSVLKTIDANAVLPLTKLFAGWAQQPVQLRFLGAEKLEQVLASLTPSGDREVNQELWKLRMEHLRITHRPDEFELAALDFCVTYEVSPPSWESARCEYKVLGADGKSGLGQTIIGEAVHDSIMSEFSYQDSLSTESPSRQMAQLSAVELSGQIHGDPVAVLDKLHARLEGADVMMISCAKLIRVDFSAAGTLLNWVSARQGEGRLVQFTDVHRLVAAFFHVIGISEHAKVVTRSD